MSTQHEPTSHESTSHEPTSHTSTSHEPTSHTSTSHEPTSHTSTSSESPDVASADGPGPLRLRIERASRPLLERMAALPVWLPFLVLLVLVLGGGFLGGPVGWVLVVGALLVILWLLYLSWPRLTPVERVMRLAVLAIFLAVAATQLIPRG